MTSSAYFRFLHDELERIGHLEAGTHYSIARVAEWRDLRLQPTPEALIHDFAIIWDSDHDERVITVLERFYLYGRLAPVVAAGERKGVLTLLLAPECAEFGSGFLASYTKEAIRLGAHREDPWKVEVGIFGQPQSRIVDENPEVADVYLRNVHLLWKLGLKDLVLLEAEERARREPVYKPGGFASAIKRSIEEPRRRRGT